MKLNEYNHKNIGIIIPNLANNQLAYETISTINLELINNSKYDYRIFFEDFGPVITNPLCATMNISEIHVYGGLLISTTLNNTVLSLKVPSKLKRAFVVWDAEWKRKSMNFLDAVKVYRDPRLILVARSQDMAKAIENYCNRKPEIIMENFNFSELAKALYGEK